jgi:hypothetical protein
MANKVAYFDDDDELAYHGKPAPNSVLEYHITFFATDMGRFPSAYVMDIFSDKQKAEEKLAVYRSGELGREIYGRDGTMAHTRNVPGRFVVSEAQSSIYKGGNGKRMK